jgi:hypothetical protein
LLITLSYVLSLMWETMFHTHIKQQAKLYFNYMHKDFFSDTDMDLQAYQWKIESNLV